MNTHQCKRNRKTLWRRRPRNTCSAKARTASFTYKFKRTLSPSCYWGGIQVRKGTGLVVWFNCGQGKVVSLTVLIKSFN